jgi:hypothetical protein
MYLVQLLMPVADSLPSASDGVLEALKTELVAHFGGFTAYMQAPAEGMWAPEAGGRAQRDTIIVVEVMTEALDRTWWHALRLRLEQDLAQDFLIVRSQAIEIL